MEGENRDNKYARLRRGVANFSRKAVLILSFIADKKIKIYKIFFLLINIKINTNQPIQEVNNHVKQ